MIEGYEVKVTDSHGREIAPGDRITDFRGRPWQFKEVSRGPLPGKIAMVIAYDPEADDEVERYASVFGLTVTPVG